MAGLVQFSRRITVSRRPVVAVAMLLLLGSWFSAGRVGRACSEETPLAKAERLSALLREARTRQTRLEEQLRATRRDCPREGNSPWDDQAGRHGDSLPLWLQAAKATVARLEFDHARALAEAIPGGIYSPIGLRKLRLRMELEALRLELEGLEHTRENRKLGPRRARINREIATKLRQYAEARLREARHFPRGWITESEYRQRQRDLEEAIRRERQLEGR